MSIERRIRDAEHDVFAALDLGVQERFLDLEQTDIRVRVLSHGHGPPLLLLHGVSLMAAAWAPLFAELHGFQLLAVDFPGHGLSDPVRYQRGGVREDARRSIESIPTARVYEMDAGHGPWLVDPAHVAHLIEAPLGVSPRREGRDQRAVDAGVASVVVEDG